MPRGRLRIYLGAAPGVGKTFAMLNEGWRRHERGTDVVVGYVETHGRANTAAQIRDLEVIPRKVTTYRDKTFEEMDVDAILARKPVVALVDELAHTNVPGSRNEKRWRDVEELLDAGIEVISTVNIQHLESVNDVVEQITGVRQHEKIPDAIVRRAEQVEIVDMTPEALRRRMAHGNIYAAERVEAALGNYFRPGNLAALRELALLWVADKVDESLHDYMETHGIDATWETRERVVVAVTGNPNGDALIRRAARMAQRSRGELIGVHIRAGDGLAAPSTGLLEEHRRLLEELGGAYQEVVGDDVGTALVRFAQAEHATQLVIGATRRSRWSELTRGSIISRVLRQAGTIDVHVISGDEVASSSPHLVSVVRQRHVALSPRRQAIGWAIALLGPPLFTLAMANLRDVFSLPTELLLYLLVVLAAAATGGILPALFASGASFLLGNWFFTPPLYTFTISEAENVLAFVVFLVVGIVVSVLVTVAARRSMEAARARSEAETLARLGGALIGGEDPLLTLMGQLRSTFEVDAIAVLRKSGPGWSVESSVGEPVPRKPDDGALSVPLDEITQLVVAGARLDPADLTILRAFTGQLGLALESRQLRSEAAVAEGLVEANELRTALLAAVSHDLRTPLASIKASASSLLQRDVEWTPEATHQFLETIDEETDRLTALVGNLLDMSRLSAGAYDLVLYDVGLEEVVGLAMSGPLERDGKVVVDVPESLPRVHADPALLERAVANLIENAVAWAGDALPVRVEAGAVGDRVDLRVVDRGPGVPPDQRDQIFQPFQRLGDRGGSGAGVGLGLAVARGFVEAMGGQIAAEDTPGGGLTMVISLPAVPERMDAAGGDRGWQR
jgi:two-component system, OmpR family, sensor histidine kinase KdpD